MVLRVGDGWGVEDHLLRDAQQGSSSVCICSGMHSRAALVSVCEAGRLTFRIHVSHDSFLHEKERGRCQGQN